MLQMINLNADNLIGLRMEGKVTTAMFEEVAAVIEERLGRHKKLRVYVEVPSFDGISAEAFFKEMQFGLRNWNRFEKEAVVTDKTWMQKTSEIFGKLYPGLEVRAFPLADAEAARQWVRV